jgi:hypothetical protein
MNILLDTVVSDEEQEELAKILSQPLVRKYFKSLGTQVATTILAANPLDTTSDAVYIRQEQYYKGQLALIETLLSIS